MEPTGARGTGGGPPSPAPSPITVLCPQPGNHSLPGWGQKAPVAAAGKEAHHPHRGPDPWRRPGEEPVPPVKVAGRVSRARFWERPFG